MMMKHTKPEVIQAIKKHRMIAIFRKIPTEKLAKTVEALYRGGIRLMEVTFDPAGEMPEEETLRQIRFIAEHYPEIFVGAGTVLRIDQVTKAADAGALYMISPNSSKEVITKTIDLGLVSMPGAFTPSESVNAHMWGADFVKIFPIGKLGSGYIKDIAAPLSHISFIAVGGVDDSNLKEYLNAGCAGVGIGSSLVNKKLIAQDRFEELEELAEKYVKSAE